MHSRHQRTLESIFSHPTPNNLEWRKIEALFIALGAEVIEGSGSRVAFILNKATFIALIPVKKPNATKL